MARPIHRQLRRQRFPLESTPVKELELALSQSEASLDMAQRFSHWTLAVLILMRPSPATQS
jgi:hypothetical protein